MWIVDNKSQMNSRAIILFLLCQLFLNVDVFSQSNRDALLANEYYNQAEYDKALELYKELENKLAIIPLIHKNYLDLLHLKQMNIEAERYLKKIRAQAPNNVLYAVDLIDHYIIVNDSIEANNNYKILESEVLENPNILRATAQFLVNNQHYNYAERLYLALREKDKQSNAYAIQLATLYRYRNQKEKMVEEYLNYAMEVPGRIRYVKSMFQLTLTEEDDINNLIKKMLISLQKNPNNETYAEVLIWANLQQNNFYGAFVQAKAMDRRNNSSGENVYEIGKLAFENSAYETAIEIFEFIISNYNSSKLYVPAKEFLILSKKEMIEQEYPIDTVTIRSLVYDYKNFIQEQGINQYTLPAYREKALLHAFYLDETETAISILKQIIENNQSSSKLVAQAKIDLADIYIILNQPWESTLLYSQVEKSNKNQEIGEIAKLKNAKVSFYMGNFQLAEEHLDILKKATRREISNNAIDLSILIKNNTILDSTQSALKDYAAVDLLLYQNKLGEAEKVLKNLFTKYKDHPILDELYWLSAQVEKQQGNYEDAINLLDIIVEELPYDILTDDALFERAKILEDYLGNESLAKELYQKLMVDYPGSIYVAEARKRFRALRGDFVN